MNRTVLVLMMAVTVEALVEYAKTFGKRDLPQALAAQGLTGGMSESALAGMYNSYGNNRNTIDRGRNESLAALLDTLNSNRSSALQSYNSQLSAAEQQKMACGENHYGFFLRCPTSFYNQPIQNSLILLRNTDTNPLAARLLSISLFFSITKHFQIINLKTRKTRFKMVI